MQHVEEYSTDWLRDKARDVSASSQPYQLQATPLKNTLLSLVSMYWLTRIAGWYSPSLPWRTTPEGSVHG
jgi:hypothetical protein